MSSQHFFDRRTHEGPAVFSMDSVEPVPPGSDPHYSQSCQWNDSLVIPENVYQQPSVSMNMSSAHWTVPRWNQGQNAALHQNFSYAEPTKFWATDDDAPGFSPGYGQDGFGPTSWTHSVPLSPQLTPTTEMHTHNRIPQGYQVHPEQHTVLSATKDFQRQSRGSGFVIDESSPQKSDTSVAVASSPDEVDMRHDGLTGNEVRPAHVQHQHQSSGVAASRGQPKKKYRVKNRAAAKRCRDKSKQYERDLSEREKEVTQQRMYLDACATALKEEILSLKQQILRHGDCECDMIQSYIAKVANEVSVSSPEATPFVQHQEYYTG